MATKKDSEEKEIKQGKTYTRPVYISVYFHGETPVSVIGIQNGMSIVSHSINKKDLTKTDWMDFLTALAASNVWSVNEKTRVTEEAISKTASFVNFPAGEAGNLKDVGNFTHKIIKTEVEF